VSSEPDDFRGWFDDLAAFVARIGQSITDFVTAAAEAANQTVDTVLAAENLARSARWCISTTWPMSLVLEIGKLAEKPYPRLAVEARLLEYYRRDDWRELTALVENACTYHSVHRARKRVLRDAVLLIRAGESNGFNAAAFAVPRLFAEFEGLLADYYALIPVKGKKSLIKSRSDVSVKAIVATLTPIASKIERPSLRLVRNQHFKTLPNFKAKPGRSLNRHRYAHGRVLAPTRITDAIRILLLIDLCAYLVDVRMEWHTDHVDRRQVYAETLSILNRIGRDLRKTKPGRQL
jgi:hypothetical protein